MALDPSIILQAGRGVVPLKSPDELADEQAVRQMRQLQVQGAQQQFADDQAYRQVLQSGASGADLVGALQKAGLGKQASQAQQLQIDQQKAGLDRGKAVAEGLKNGAASILANPTEQNAIATLTQAQQLYGLPAEMVDGAKARIYQARNDPNALRQLAMGWGADAEKVLGKFQTVDMGGSQVTQRVNPLTGQIEVAGEQAKSASPSAVLASQTAIRGQNMVDSRAREQAQAGRVPSGYRLAADGQSLEFIPGGPADPASKAGGGKPLTEGQSKALLFGTRMQEANSIFDDLAEKGVTTSVPGSRTGYGVGAVISALQPADRQRLDQAKRDFINATLRRESGAVISDSEFRNAELQYFPQIGDSAEVIAQKKRNREVAMRGVLAEVPDSEGRVSQIRTPGAQPVSQKAGPKPKTKPLNIGGKDMMAELAPDGNYYVQQNGKWFKVKE